MKKVISSKNSYMYSFFLISSAICIYLSNICSFETGNLRHNSSISEVDNRSSMLKTGSFDSYCFLYKCFLTISILSLISSYYCGVLIKKIK